MPTDLSLRNDLPAVIAAVRTAWQQGRRIVPIVGAGISADSGIPVIPSLLRYFGKLRQYLSHRVYLPPPTLIAPSPLGSRQQLAEDALSRRDTGIPEDVFAPIAKRYGERPWEYIAANGWPDRFDLNQELLGRLERFAADEVRLGLTADAERCRLSSRVLVSDCQQVGLQEILLDLYPGLTGSFRDWRAIIQYFTRYQGDQADVLFHQLCAGRRPTLGHRYLAFLVKLLSIRMLFTFNFDELIERALTGEGVTHQTFAMEHGRGLPHPDLVRDVLAVVKLHGSSHSLLLDQRLDHPLDDAYKKRFTQLTGRQPLILVLGCSGGDGRLLDLIHHAVVAAEAEVCWIHFEKPAPTPVGDIRTRVSKEWTTRPIEPRRGALLERRQEPLFLTAPTHNVGLTLQHVYGALTGRNPASPIPYPAHLTRPYLYAKGPPDVHSSRRAHQAAGDGDVEPASAATSIDRHRRMSDEYAFCLFKPARRAGTSDEYSERTTAEVLVELAGHWAMRGYQTVWVDLESLHTLAGVVGTIIDQCAVFDTTLAPSVLPVQDGKKENLAVETGVRRVKDALRRARYLVMIDGLEAFTWPPTTHHGETSAASSKREAKLAELREFLCRLADGQPSIGESKVLLGIDQFRSRTRSADTKMQLDYAHLVTDLERNGWRPSPEEDGGVRQYSSYYVPPTPDGDTPFVTVTDEFIRQGPGERAVEPSPTTLRSISEQAWGLILLVLSAVRRPRSLVLLRHLLRPLFRSGEEVEAVVAWLTGPAGPVSGMLRLEGGGLWYCRPVRDYVYSENSKYVASTEDLIKCFSPAGADQRRLVKRAAAQAFTLGVTHHKIARIYHTVSFVQTQDAGAFLEYIYHTISSLRYIAKLLVLLTPVQRPGRLPKAGKGRRAGVSTEGRSPAFAGVAAACEAINGGLKDSGNQTLWWEFLGETNSIRNLQAATESELRDSLLKQHAAEISALSHAWVRAEPLLRTQLPAEQLIYWCETLLDDDLPRRIDRVRTGHDLEPLPESIIDDAVDKVNGLIGVVRDFKVKLHFERAEYAAAAAERLWQLDRVRGRAKRTLQESSSAAPWKQYVTEHLTGLNTAEVHYLLDGLACVHKLAQEGQAESPWNDDVGSTLAAQMDELVSPAPDEPPPLPIAGAAVGDQEEAALRLRYLWAEGNLGEVSVFGWAGGFPGDTEAIVNRKDQIKQASKHVESALARVRAQPHRADGRLRSLILDPVVGGNLYLPYRAAFMSQRARLNWLQAAATTGDLDDAFEGAFRTFEMALGGLGSTNHQIAALNELFRVEACLARARFALHPSAAAPNRPPFTESLLLAGAKFEAARDGLQRARVHLMTGRRNVIWWKLFYALCAQYHADRLLLAVAHLLIDWPAARKSTTYLEGTVRPGQVLARLRRGYSALRSALDLSPRSEQTPPWPWLGRAWWEMTAAATAVGWVILTHTAERQPTNRMKAVEKREYLGGVLHHVGVAARLLTPSELGDDGLVCRELSGWMRVSPVDEVAREMDATLRQLTKFEKATADKFELACHVAEYRQGILNASATCFGTRSA